MKQELGIKILGKVIQGERYGRSLGFPTANLDRRDYLKRTLKIKFGVYAGWAIIDGRLQRSPLKAPIKGKYLAAIVIGPLDKKGLPKIEAHLLGFKGNLYGKKMTFFLQKYLRPYKKFKNTEELKLQIKKDISSIKKMTKLT